MISFGNSKKFILIERLKFRTKGRSRQTLDVVEKFTAIMKIEPHDDVLLIPRNFYYLYRKARRKERDGDASQSDTKIYLEESVLELLKFTPAELRSMVDLPAGLDYNEWLASYSEYHRETSLADMTDERFLLSAAIQIFEYVNLVYGTISEHCTTTGCPDMTAPGSK